MIISLILLNLFLDSFGNSQLLLHRDQPKNLEIRDKSGETVLGYDGKYVYMIISEASLQQLNNQILVDYYRDLQTFTDSNGLFIPAEVQVLKSRRIAYDVEELSIRYSQYGIHFEYLSPTSVRFEDIILSNGLHALQNFDPDALLYFVQQLEKS